MSEHTQVLSSQTLNYSCYHGNHCLCQSTSERVGRRHELLPWQHASLQQHLTVYAILFPKRRNGYWEIWVISQAGRWELSNLTLISSSVSSLCLLWKTQKERSHQSPEMFTEGRTHLKLQYQPTAFALVLILMFILILHAHSVVQEHQRSKA